MRSSTALLLLALVGCGGIRLAAPPAVFPVTTLWTVPLEAAAEPPLVSDGALLFVLTGAGDVLALDPASGAQVWRWHKRPGRLAAVPGRLVLRESDGTVWGLDPGTGERAWKADSGVSGDPEPVLDAHDVIVAGAGVAAIEARTGRLRWKVDDLQASAPATLSGTTVLVPGADGALHCLDRATGNTLWSHDLGGPLRAAVVVDERGRAYAGTTAHRIVALRLDKRGREEWSWHVGTDVPFPPVILGDTLVATTFENVLYALDRRSGSLAWRATLPSRTVSGPVLAGSAVVVACHESELLAFDGRDGTRLGTLGTATPLRAGPIVAGVNLALGLRNPWSVVGLRYSLEAGPEPTPQP